MGSCVHESITCVNQYEIVRKYRCEACRGIMICACDEGFARTYLPHQINEAQEYATHRRMPVTLGFVANTCNACRGLPEEAFPKAASYGRTSKIARYYWREILRETLWRFGDWAVANGHRTWIEASGKHEGVRKEIERHVIADIKLAHEKNPRYDFAEESQRDI